MNQWKMIGQSLRKQGVRPWLLVCQLFVGFLALVLGLGLVEGMNGYEKLADDLAPRTEVHIQAATTSAQREDNVTTQGLQALYEKIKQLPAVTAVGTYQSLNIEFDETRANPDKFPAQPKLNSNAGALRVAFLDASYLQLHTPPVTAGRTLQPSDLQQKRATEIPIIVGAGVATYYPVGTVLHGTLLDPQRITVVPKTFKIVGVLPTGYAFWTGGTRDLRSSLLASDFHVIAPMQAEQNIGHPLKSRLGENLQVRLQDGTDVEAFKHQLEQTLASGGLRVDAYTVQEQIDYMNQANGPLRLFALSFAALLLLLASCGLLGVFLASIVRRKREFGLRFALGSSPRALALLVGGELLLLIALSAGLGILASVLLGQALPDRLLIEIGWQTAGLTVVAVLLIGLLALALPMRRVARLEPITLLRGDLY